MQLGFHLVALVSFLTLARWQTSCWMQKLPVLHREEGMMYSGPCQPCFWGDKLLSFLSQTPSVTFLSQLIFGTFLPFKIMKILLLYAAGAFLSPEILYQEYRGALTINLFFSLHFQPVPDCISTSEQCCNFPGHPLSPEGFFAAIL